MGNLYLAIILGSLISLRLWADEIVLEPTIPKNDAPTKSLLEADRELTRRLREKWNQKPPVKERSESDRLIEEQRSVRDLRFMTQVNLVLPRLRTSGEREDYDIDFLTSHFSFYVRLGDGPLESGINYTYMGLRIAPFSGYGKYDSTLGRFGFTYIGPAFGFGILDKEVLDNRKQLNAKAADGTTPVRLWSGFLVSFGVAGMSSLAARDPSSQEPNKDILSSKGLRLDGTGLWAELSYLTIPWGAVGINYSLGVQLGEGKSIAYLSVGIGGWH